MRLFVTVEYQDCDRTHVLEYRVQTVEQATRLIDQMDGVIQAWVEDKDTMAILR